MVRLYVFAVALVLVMIGTTVFSSVIFSRIDLFVNTDLYDFGLTFNQDWMTPYTKLLWIINSLFTVSTTLSCTSILFLILPLLERVSGKDESRFAGLIKVISILFIGVVAGLVAMSFLYVTRPFDFLVNNDLYTFGLGDTELWYDTYKQNLSILQGLLMTAIGSGLASILLLFRTRLPDKLLRLSLEQTWLFPTFLGLSAMGFAFFVDSHSSLLAMVGVGSIFCGLILRFLSGEHYTRKILLDTAIKSQILATEKLIKNLRLPNRVAVYLPLKYLSNQQENKVYLMATSSQVSSSASIEFTPPGNELVKVWEKRLKKNFVEVDLNFLLETLPDLISELEIAEKLEITVADDKLVFELEKCIYDEGSRDILSSSEVMKSLGSPVISAIACALAKAAANPVIITKEAVTSDLLIAEYTFLEGETI